MKAIYIFDDMAEEIKTIAENNNLMEAEVMDMLCDYIKEMCDDNNLEYSGDIQYNPLYPH